MVTHEFENVLGGGQISCQLLVNQLEKMGHNVSVLSRVSREQFRNLDRRFPYQYFDVVHSYNMDSLVPVGKITKRYDVSSVATLNGIVYSPSLSNYMFKSFSPRYYRNQIILNNYIKYIKRFTTLFQFFKERWVEDGLSENRIMVIPNMIDNSFKPVKHIDSDYVRLLYVGNYSPTRSDEIRRLIEIYSLLPKQDIFLYVVGKGKKWVERLVKRYKPSNLIIHKGMVSYDEMPSVYANADIFVHPSLYPKTTDRVVYEALLSGLCVMTTGNDFYSPVVKNMVGGVLIYPFDKYRWVKYLQEVIDSKSLRERLAKGGKKQLIELCNPNRITNQYLKLYEQLN